MNEPQEIDNLEEEQEEIEMETTLDDLERERERGRPVGAMVTRLVVISLVLALLLQAHRTLSAAPGWGLGEGATSLLRTPIAEMTGSQVLLLIFLGVMTHWISLVLLGLLAGVCRFLTVGLFRLLGGTRIS